MINKTVYQGDAGATINAVLSYTDGTPIDLTDATEVRFLMRPTIGNGPTVDAPAAIDADPTTGKVSYDLQDADVTTPGDYQFAFRAIWPEGAITYPTNAPLTLRVIDSSTAALPTIAQFVTIDEAYLLTGDRMTDSQLLQSQIDVGAYLDRDLSDTQWLTEISQYDTRRLKQGVAYQATALKSSDPNSTAASGATGGVGFNLPPGVKSITQGPVSLTFTDTAASAGSPGGSSGSGGGPGELSTSAKRILDRLSWRHIKTLKPQSMFEDGDINYPDWEIMFDIQPVVRPPLDPWDETYWRTIV